MSQNQSNEPSSSMQAPRLLDRLRGRLQARGYGLDMQNRYVEWCRQFILFHQKRHPAELGEEEVRQFLASLAQRRLPMAWQREAWQGVGFLYREEIGRVMGLPELGRCFPETTAPAPGGAGKPRLLDQV